MTKTLIGIAMNPDGMSSTRSLDQNGRLRTRGWSTPTNELRRRQKAVVPIDVAHDGIARGQVIYLERAKGGQLWAVGHADIDPPQWMLPFYWSTSITCLEDGTDIELQALAIGPGRRAHGLPALKMLDGDLQWRRRPLDSWRDQTTSHERGLLERAANYHLDRPRGAPLVIHDAEVDQVDLDRLEGNARTVALTLASDLVVEGAWMNAPLRHRPGRIVDVR